MGRAWKYEDDINTDVIYPGRYTYKRLSPEEMAGHAMEDLDPEFAKNVKEGDYVVAGKNFGMGSSREQAAACLKYAGIKAVIAKSFARIYYRNAINFGLPAITIDTEGIDDGDEIDVDLEKGVVINRTKSEEYRFPPFPENVMKIIEAGGLIEYAKAVMKRDK